MSEAPVAQFWFAATALPEHIDELGHVNNKVYVAWAEEAGVRHWRAFATPEEKAQYVWVAARFEMDFLRETKLGETLRVETWLGELRGARFDRHVRILGADGKERARAKTTWALLDAVKRRPARVPIELAERFARTVC
ncbi:MAG: acyl-CoA thioesterase [Hyphomonadaceae bacterium]|nr:acyl-CoA thioesterase [Hyphomonadaceae bacterium]